MINLNSKSLPSLDSEHSLCGNIDKIDEILLRTVNGQSSFCVVLLMSVTL